MRRLGGREGRDAVGWDGRRGVGGDDVGEAVYVEHRWWPEAENMNIVFRLGHRLFLVSHASGVL